MYSMKNPQAHFSHLMTPVNALAGLAFVALFYVMPVFNRRSLFFACCHFNNTDQIFKFVLNYVVQTRGDVVVMIPMQSHALLALPVPVAQGVWAGTFCYFGICGQFSVL